MRLTYVTGASCAGKTTLHDVLADSHPRVVAVELDAAESRPRTGEVEWLRWQALEWLWQVIESERNDAVARDHVIVSGIVWPFEVCGSRLWREAGDIDVRFVHLDRPWAEMRASLVERLAGWDKADAEEQIENNRRLQRQLRQQTQAIRGGYVIADGDQTVAARAIVGTTRSPL